jgi:hypothetical protein
VAVGLALGEVSTLKPRAFASVVVGLLALLWGRQLRILAGDWIAGGTLASRVVDGFEAEAATLPRSAAYFVFDLPGYEGEALCLPTYFFLAAQVRLSRPDLLIHERGSSATPGAVEAALSDRRPGDLVMRWDFSSGAWKLIP